LVYKTYTIGSMPSTFDENKQSCKEYLQKIIDYIYRGHDSCMAATLSDLQSVCSEYLQNFEARCQTDSDLRDFRRTMENEWDLFHQVLVNPAEGSWEETMLSTLTSYKDVCIHNLNEMGGKPLTAAMILYRLRDI